MKSYRVLTACLIGAGAILLASCSADRGDAPESESKTGSTIPKEAVNEPIELTFYTTSSFDNETFMSMIGSPIVRKYPHITPKLIPSSVPLKEVIATGGQLDVFFGSVAATPTSLIDNGLQYDISSLIQANKYDLSRLEQSLIAIQKQFANGGIYGLPWSAGALTLYYNRDLFNKFGVPYPEDGMSWDEVYDITRKMSRMEGDTKYLGMVFGHRTVLSLNTLSASLIDGKTNKGKLTEEPFKNVFKTLADFLSIPNNGVHDGANNNAFSGLNLFQKEQRAAMMLSLSTFGTSSLKDSVNWDVVTYPYFKEKPNVGPQSYPNYLYVTSTSKHKEAAFKAIAEITTDESQRHISRQGRFPVTLSAMKEYGQDLPYMKDKNLKGFLPATFAAPAGVSKFDDIALGALTSAFTAVVANNADINTVLREANEKVDKDIAAALASE